MSDKKIKHLAIHCTATKQEDPPEPAAVAAGLLPVPRLQKIWFLHHFRFINNINYPLQNGIVIEVLNNIVGSNTKPDGGFLLASTSGLVFSYYSGSEIRRHLASFYDALNKAEDVAVAWEYFELAHNIKLIKTEAIKEISRREQEFDAAVKSVEAVFNDIPDNPNYKRK